MQKAFLLKLASLFFLVGAALTRTAGASELETRAGEILMEGTVRAVHPQGSTLTLQASGYCLPDGRWFAIKPSLDKKVFIGTQTRLRAGDDRKRAIELKQIAINDFAMVVGMDGGKANRCALAKSLRGPRNPVVLSRFTLRTVKQVNPTHCGGGSPVFAGHPAQLLRD